VSARALRLLRGAALAVAGAGAALDFYRSESDVGSSGAADTAMVSRSIAWLEGRLSREPDNTEVAGRLATRYVLRFGTGADLADVHRAEVLARGLVGAGPDSAAALARLSGILLMQHEFARALDAAARAVAAEPSSPEALGAFADAALATGRTREGHDALGRLPARSLGTLVRRAQWLEAEGNHTGAYALMDRVCRSLERSAARPQVVAWCLTELARTAGAVAGADAARGRYQRAVRILPGYRAAIEGLANQALERRRSVDSAGS
jgi:tetratricopeptide (TPR) repeat protein